MLLIVLLVLFQCGLYQTAPAFAQDEEADIVQEEIEEPFEDAEPEETEEPEEEIEAPLDEQDEAPPAEEPTETEEPAPEAEEPEAEPEEDPATILLVMPVHNITQDTYYNTISDAIDAAVAGDTIEVAPGTYSEHVLVDVDNLTLRSTDGASVTILTGNNPIVEVAVDNVHIEGFSFIDQDTGIQVHDISGGTIVIEDCHFNVGIMHPVLFAGLEDAEVHLIGNHTEESWRGFYFAEEIFTSTIVIEDNYFELIKERGVSFAKDIQTSSITIDSNTFIGDLTKSAVGIYTDSSIADLGIYDESELIITNNSFADFDDTAVYIYYIDFATTAMINDNTFEDCYYGVYFDYIGYSETDEGCYVRISGNTMEGVEYGVYVDDVYYYSTLSIDGNVFEDGYQGVYIYYLEFESTAHIDNNTFTGVEYAIEIDYVGYDDPELPCYAYIRNNHIENAYYGIEIDDIYFGSVHITENTLINCGYGIYIDELGYEEKETDVRILNNSITVTEDAGDLGLGHDFYYGIYMCCPERILRIEGNTISGTADNMYDYGISAYDLGCCGEEPFLMHLHDNTISFCEYGVYLDDVPCCMSGDFFITGNVLQDNDYGIYMEYVGNYETYILLQDNSFLQNETGLYVYDLSDDTDEPTEFIVTGNRFVANSTGAYFGDIYLSESGSWLGIFGNDFVNNNSGLVFSDIYLSDPMFMSITANNFSGNSDFAIDNQTEETVIALNNWWGHPDGPVVKTQNGYLPTAAQTIGDPVSENVEFDPWISTVELLPATATADTGIAKTFTASIYNSDSELVTAAGLYVRFDVTGSHTRTETVSVGGGTAAFTYTGSNTGTDGIWATVLFAGEETTLRDSAAMVWTGTVTPPGDDEEPLEPLPDTGMDTAFIWLGLTSIASGVVIRKKRVA